MIAEADLNGVALAGHPNIGLAEFAEQVERGLRDLTERQAERVVGAALARRLLDVAGDAVETVGGGCAADPLVRSLMVVIPDPVFDSLASVGEGSEDGVFEILRPDRLPEALDLPERHRVVRRAANVLDSLALQRLLEFRFPPPGDELSAVVAEQLARRSPLPDRALDDLHDRVGRLSAEQAVADDVARVIVDDSD